MAVEEDAAYGNSREEEEKDVDTFGIDVDEIDPEMYPELAAHALKLSNGEVDESKKDFVESTRCLL